MSTIHAHPDEFKEDVTFFPDRFKEDVNFLFDQFEKYMSDTFFIEVIKYMILEGNRRIERAQSRIKSKMDSL